MFTPLQRNTGKTKAQTLGCSDQIFFMYWFNVGNFLAEEEQTYLFSLF